MRVLFLDFDGVLNHEGTYQPAQPGGLIVLVTSETERLDSACVARVNRIVRETGARVVVSSTWRHEYDRAQLQGHLTRHGFEGDVFDVTPILSGRPRGLEICAWLEEHPYVEAFAILDDNGDMGPVVDRLVQTSFAHGLQDEHVDRVIALLNGTA